ncbi:MAG: YlbF family regulator [Proteobacteria bacterium]|nr:YlbF family regulator [Pseudomonadota bacterium]
MTDLLLNELEVAPLEVVPRAAHDFAAVLAAAPQFSAFEEAAYAFQQDEAAQAALQAYQARQQSLQMMLMLNAVNAEDRAELTRLWDLYASQNGVILTGDGPFKGRK